jgi:hypothetical protein
MALEAVKCHLFFKVFAFIYFISSFIHIQEWEEHSWFLNMLWPKLNYYYVTPFQNVWLLIWH